MIPGAIIATATGDASTALRFVGRNWKAIAAGTIVLGLALALWLARRDAAGWEKKADERQAELAGERAAHAVTRASVDRLETVVAQKNAESRARAVALEQAKVQAAADIAAADERWRATSDQVERLRMLAKEKGKPGCEVPKRLAAELENL